MSLEQADFLADLCSAPGISGFEQPVARLITERLYARGIQTTSDRLGNVIAAFPGTGPRVMLFAHTDEVGFIIRKIHADGFLYLERVGGASVRALPGQRLQVWTDDGAVPGVVGIMPQHLSGDSPAPGLAEVYVDIGACNREAALRLGVQVGSPVTFRPAFEALDGRLASKALDDRLGCFILLQLAHRLQAHPAQCEVLLAFVTQEETRLQGAVPVASHLRPDWALGLDATLAFDTPDLPNGQTEVRLGGGPAIKIMDHLRGMGLGFVPHLGLRRHIEAVAAAEDIPLQREVVIGLSTAAAPLPFLGAGLPVAAVSFPLRYSHSPVEVADAGDADATLQLLEAVMRSPWKD